MLTATKDRILPTTVTGSWPRPAWYTQNLARRPFSDAMTDIAFREQLTDAIEVVLGDQDRAGLDILTNGDYHLDADVGGRSWFAYPSERLGGMSEYDTETTFGWRYPTGSWLNEIVGGWKYHAVVDKVVPDKPLEFAKIWRIAQARTERVQDETHEGVVALSISNRPAYESERRQGELGDLIGPQEGGVEKAARNDIGEHGAKLADQRNGDHHIGERVDDGGHRSISCETGPASVIARLDRAIQYPTVGGYWIARSSRAMTPSLRAT